MTKAYRRGISEAQSNALALERRGRTYADANAASITLSWDWRKREPRDLREAVRMVRQAYADEVPAKMHNSELADDGTPRMTPQAEGYIFGNPTRTDAGGRAQCVVDCRFHPDNVFGDLSEGGRHHEPHCPAHPDNRPLLSYYLTPFRATLADMERGDPQCQRRAAIVRHVTIGSQGPQEAAIAEKAHPFDAKLVAEDALRAFIRRLSDVRVDARTEAVA